MALYVDFLRVSMHRFPDCSAAAGLLHPIAWKQAPGVPSCIRCERRETARLLPEYAGVGECRLCGQTAQLTLEHLPPQAAFNADRASARTGEEWMASPSLDLLPGGRLVQGGIGGYTLCQPCNSLTGTRYGVEFCNWAMAIHARITGDFDLAAGQAMVDQEPWVTWELDPAYPGRFVRQVLSMMCSVSGGELRRAFPAVRDIVLDGVVAPLPPEISLHMAIAPDPQRARILGGFEEQSVVTGEVARVAEITHYPFSFLLVLEGQGVRPRRGADISTWTTVDVNAEAQVRVNGPLAFCNTPIPGDYRTRAQIEAGVQLP